MATDGNAIARWRLPAALLWLALATPPLRAALEGSMLAHMLLQMPLLAGVGALLAAGVTPRSPRLRARWADSMRGGACGLVFAGFVLTLWMLPRLLDAAVLDWRYEVAKFVLLPSAGAALVAAWPRCPPLARVLVQVEVIATLLRFGWGNFESPERLCAVYLLREQQQLGAMLLALGALYAAAVTLPALFGPLRWPRLRGAHHA